MKKILFVLLTICLLASSAFAVSAQTEIAKLNLDYTVKDNGNILVTASVVDITDESGIVVLFYDISIDSSKVEVVSSNVNMPSEWKDFEESGMSEVLFNYNQNSNKYVWWSSFVGEPNQGYGITADNEFRIEIELKPLSTCETSISFSSDSVYTDADVNLENPLKTESKGISINITASTNTESSENAGNAETSSEADVSSETVGNISSDAVSDEIDVSSEIESIPQESENNSFDSVSEDVEADSSDDSINSESKVISEDASDVEVSDIPEESSLSQITDESSDISDDDKNDDSNNIVIIVVIVLVLALVGGGAFFIIKSKKGKKQ